jgi:hypothetical protein
MSRLLWELISVGVDTNIQVVLNSEGEYTIDETDGPSPKPSSHGH